jgi:hypothetical protein
LEENLISINKKNIKESIINTNNNVDLSENYFDKPNTIYDNAEIISYGTFLNLNKNATKQERRDAIYNFYKKIMG